MDKDFSNNTGCFGRVLRLFGINSKIGGISFIKTTPDEPLPYRVRDDFLSPAEKSFYRILWYVAGKQAAICTKVNLNDIFFVLRPNENQAFRNKIAYKHVDFLLCNPKSMQPVVGIELDDSSHSRPKQEERDEFVERVFQAAALPLVRVPVHASYNTQELLLKLSPYLEKIKEGNTTISAEATQPPINDTAPPLCPKCGVPMSVRVAAKGEHQGKKFYGCPNFPRCREVKPYTYSA